MELHKDNNYDQKTVDDFLNYISGVDSNASNWYVGIATNPNERLFDDHNVDKDKGSWIYSRKLTESIARGTEKYLLKKYAFKGGDGGGKSPKFVYAYKITANTRE